MPVYRIYIAEHTVQIAFLTEADERLFLSLFPNLQPSSVEGEPDLHVEIKTGYCDPFTTYAVQCARVSDGEVRYARTDYQLWVDSTRWHASIEAYDGLALKHAFMHLYSLYIVKRQWGLLVHSSCIHEGGQAHLFAGHSGAGKSTVALLSKPRPIYSDEASILRIQSGRVEVFDSPFRSDVHTPRDSQLHPSPLHSIQLLRQSEVNCRLPLDKGQGLLEMMDKVFFWSPSSEEAAAILLMLRELADQVPIYQLYFRKEPTFWELIS